MTKVIELQKDKDGIYRPTGNILLQKDDVNNINAHAELINMQRMKKQQQDIAEFIVENGIRLENFLTGVKEIARIIRIIKKM